MMQRCQMSEAATPKIFSVVGRQALQGQGWESRAPPSPHQLDRALTKELERAREPVPVIGRPLR